MSALRPELERAAVEVERLTRLRNRAKDASERKRLTVELLRATRELHRVQWSRPR